VVAAGLAATTLSFSVGVAHADDASGASAKAFSGYSSTGVATPVKIELFEPTIPIPTNPQLELDLGYTRVKADSTTTRARASFLWPGDGVGEGAKTFFEQLGLPTAPVEDGYPVQVNSQYPSETIEDEQSPFPGTSMRTRSGEDTSRATVGFSSNCDAGDGAPSEDGDAASDGSDGGLPELPGAPELPLLDNLGSLLSLAGLDRAPTTTRSFSRATSDDDSDDAPCQLPEALAALVDVNGYVADTESVATDDLATLTSRAALGDVRLLGGIVTMSGITSTVVASSDGATGQSQGRADYGTVTIAGQTFGLGPEGYVAAGQAGSIPGLPDDPAAALARLGITVQLPAPAYRAVGDKAAGTVEGLIVTIDLETLRPALSQLQLGPILDQVPFPPEAGPLKSLLGALGNLSPKIVLHLGYTTATVDTVQAIPIPPTVPDNDPTGEDADGGDAAGGATGGASAGGGAGLAPGTAVPPGDGSGPTGTATTQPVTDAALSAGLPKLFSIPGLLMAVGLGGALLAGNYVRRIGALVLGGAAACSHGLESGLPDLRKVQP
jgi:hypothetical protein